MTTSRLTAGVKSMIVTMLFPDLCPVFSFASVGGGLGAGLGYKAPIT